MSYSLNTKKKAIILRKKGYSLKEVAEALGIAKSTSSQWLRGISLSDDAQKRLEKRGILGQYRARATIRERRKKQDIYYTKWAEDILRLLPKSKDTYRMYCSLLYWAEGGKYSDTHLTFTNSDPMMISTYLLLLRKGFSISESKLRANIHLHEYHDEIKQKSFWSSVTGIPLKQFNKSYLKKNTKIRIRDDYPGCVRICYYSADVTKRIRALYKGIYKHV